MTGRQCVICEADHYARDWCLRHYMQWFRTGRITNVHPATITERLAARTSAPDENGCRRWTGAHFPSGYAQIKYRGETRSVHTVLWELANGDRSTRLEQLHHVCEHKWCVAPEHVVPVTALAHNVIHREQTTRARWGR